MTNLQKSLFFLLNLGYKSYCSLYSSLLCYDRLMWWSAHSTLSVITSSIDLERSMKITNINILRGWDFVLISTFTSTITRSWVLIREQGPLALDFRFLWVRVANWATSTNTSTEKCARVLIRTRVPTIYFWVTYRLIFTLLKNRPTFGTALTNRFTGNLTVLTYTVPLPQLLLQLF